MIVYTICLVFGLIFTVFSAVFGHLFGGHEIVGTDGQADAGFNADGVPGISFFSPTVLASFVTAFGAFGLIFCQIGATSSVWVNAPISFVGGLGVAIFVLWLFNAVFRTTQGSSEGLVANLIGQTAWSVRRVATGSSWTDAPIAVVVRTPRVKRCTEASVEPRPPRKLTASPAAASSASHIKT